MAGMAQELNVLLIQRRAAIFQLFNMVANDAPARAALHTPIAPHRFDIRDQRAPFW